MSSRVALLRGVNVGGNKAVPAAELRATAESLGLAAARTLINSGNLVFGSDRGEADLEAALGDAIDARLGVRCRVFVRTAQDWAGLIAANPFPDAAERNPSQLVAHVLDAAPTAEALDVLSVLARPDERLQATGRVLYADFAGGLGQSKLAEAIAGRKSPVTNTARNWNTVLKLDALLRA